MAQTGNGTFRYRGNFITPAFQEPAGSRRSWLESYLTEPTARTSGLIILSSGVLVAFCSVLPWLDGTTGISLMFSGKFGSLGNVFFSHVNGMLYLSGLWALLLGPLAAVGGYLRTKGREAGATLALAAGGLAALVALLNILMAFTRGAVYHNTPGAGVWLMLALSGAVVAEVLLARLPEDYLQDELQSPAGVSDESRRTG